MSDLSLHGLILCSKAADEKHGPERESKERHQPTHQLTKPTTEAFFVIHSATMTEMTIIDPVQQIVMSCLHHFAYQDAIFLSERLHAEVQSEESLYLLALSHYRSGSKSLRAYHLLKERQLKMPKAKYLLAKCCLELNKYSEAESVLTSEFLNGHLGSSSSSSSSKTMPTSHTSAGAELNFNTKLHQSQQTSSNSAAVTSNASQAAAAPVSSKHKLYDEILKEYGSEYSAYVLQILATVYS